MKHIAKYNQIYEASKPIDIYHMEANRLTLKYEKEISDLYNKFKTDVMDCMYDLTDHTEWLIEKGNERFEAFYTFKIDLDNFDDFVKEINISLNNLENNLGVKYFIYYSSGECNIGILEDFNKNVNWYKKQIQINYIGYIIFKIYIGGM